MCIWSDIAEGYEIHYVNAWPKRCVFNLDLNRESRSEPWMLSGRLFQSLGAKCENALLSLTCRSLSTVRRRWLRVSPVPARIQSEIETCQDRQHSHGPAERQFRAWRQWGFPAEAQSLVAHHFLATHVLHTARADRTSRTCTEPIRMRPRPGRTCPEEHEHRCRLLGPNQQTRGRSLEPEIGSTHQVQILEALCSGGCRIGHDEISQYYNRLCERTSRHYYCCMGIVHVLFFFCPAAKHFPEI